MRFFIQQQKYTINILILFKAVVYLLKLFISFYSCIKFCSILVFLYYKLRFYNILVLIKHFFCMRVKLDALLTCICFFMYSNSWNTNVVLANIPLILNKCCMANVLIFLIKLCLGKCTCIFKEVLLVA